MTTHMRWLATAALFLSVACTGSGDVSHSDAKAAAAISRQIQANPERAEQILTDAGTNAAAFEAQLYAISKDPEASAAYAQAMKN